MEYKIAIQDYGRKITLLLLPCCFANLHLLEFTASRTTFWGLAL